MLAQDLQPNRVEVAKSTVKQFIEGRTSDRIGLVAFAAEALTQVPLTTDYQVVLQAVDNLQPGQLEDGTAIGNAIATAANRLRNAPGKSRVMILLTDGVNNRGDIDPMTAAQAARAYGIKIYTIGVGTEGMAPVPVGRGLYGLRFEEQPVEIDEALLTRISQLTGGRYFRARDAAALRSIYSQIDALERTPVQSTTYVRYAELFRWPLGLALLSLLDRAGCRGGLGAAPMTRFLEWPWALSLAIVLPVLGIAAMMLGRKSRARRLARLGTKGMLARLAPRGARLGAWHSVRIVCALLLLGAAFAGPRWGRANAVVKQSGSDIVLALDASLSMTAQDEKPSRLEKMKQVVRQLRALSPNDRFALIAFAGRSYILTPLTSDDGALDLYLDNLDPSVVGEAGSSMASALRQATTLLTLGNGNGDKAIVLMSDGEAWEPIGDILTEAKRAKDAGIQLVTVGFGTTAGATIPVTVNGTTTLKRDENGQVVVTHYTPETLRSAAEAADGVFVPADASQKAESIRRVIDRLKTEAHAVATGRDLIPRFQWFVAPALLLLLLDTFLGLRTRRRAARLIAAGALGAAAACAPNRSAIDVAAYNRGTTLVQHDSMAPGAAILDSVAARSVPMRFAASFNSGWAYLVTGLKLHGDTAAVPLDSALARYRRALSSRRTILTRSGITSSPSGHGNQAAVGAAEEEGAAGAAGRVAAAEAFGRRRTRQFAGAGRARQRGARRAGCAGTEAEEERSAATATREGLVIAALLLFAQVGIVQFETRVTPDTVYVGQQVSYDAVTLVDDVARARLRANPEFTPADVTGVTVYDFPFDTAAISNVVVNGVHFRRYVYHRALFALTPGSYSVGPATLSYSLPESGDYFSQPRAYSLQSAPATFVALPLPESGRPIGFSGAVGELKDTLWTDGSPPKVGDTFVVTMRIAGLGNLKMLPRPQLQIDWATTIDGPERVLWDSSGTTVRGAKEFDWVVTPQGRR